MLPMVAGIGEPAPFGAGERAGPGERRSKYAGIESIMWFGRTVERMSLASRLRGRLICGGGMPRLERISPVAEALPKSSRLTYGYQAVRVPVLRAGRQMHAFFRRIGGHGRRVRLPGRVIV